MHREKACLKGKDRGKERRWKGKGAKSAETGAEASYMVRQRAEDRRGWFAYRRGHDPVAEVYFHGEMRVGVNEVKDERRFPGAGKRRRSSPLRRRLAARNANGMAGGKTSGAAVSQQLLRQHFA